MNRNDKVKLLKRIASGETPFSALAGNDSFLVIYTNDSNSNTLINLTKDETYILNNDEIIQWQQSKDATTAKAIFSLPHNSR